MDDLANRVHAALRQWSGPGANAAWLLCDRHPDQAVAFTIVDDDGRFEVTFGELRCWLQTCAAGMRELGVGSDDRVATLMGKSRELVGVFTADGRWYLTGDAASRDGSGAFFFSARADDVIVTAGYRIGPFDVESAIGSHPEVAECAVVAGPDALRGEVVEAFVVTRGQVRDEAAPAVELQELVRRHVGAHAYPRRVRFRAELPKTPSGKIQRFALRADRNDDQLSRRNGMNTPQVAPAQTQQQIAWIGGSVHRVVLDGAATDNQLAVFRSTMGSGAASPVHVHDRDDETVVVLSGSGIFWAGDQRWDLGPGDAVFLPRRVPHSYLFTSDTEIITICHPSGMEELFRAVGWDLAEPQPQDWTVDMEKLHAAGEAGRQHVLGPPLAAGDAMPAHYLAPHDR